jgi:transglutaminase superfamily protein
MGALALNRLKNGLLVVRLLPGYVLFGLLKHVVPLRWLVRWAWCPPHGPRDLEGERRLAARVCRLSRLTGLLDRDCLQRSLLLYRMLSRAGANPTLVVGFRRMDGRIFGHAWVIVDGYPVIEPEVNLLRFSPMFGFGFGGEPLPAITAGWPSLNN